MAKRVTIEKVLNGYMFTGMEYPHATRLPVVKVFKTITVENIGKEILGYFMDSSQIKEESDG